ncbi:MAG: RelA/SpoT family protein [Candidatus Coprovivens sp.]
MTIEDVIKEIELYNPDEIENVRKAYKIAEKAHSKQKRESGEPYIIHPLNVCMNLTKFKADGSSLCAGLLHDVVEDTDYTLEDIRRLFNDDVAFLVDGVTKISNLHYNTKDEATNANIRRLINSLNDDARIIIIKLCDRLHNMQTLEYKAPEKRIRSANETLNIFVPLAYFIGAFRLKCELEDICLSYLDKESYDTLKIKEKEIWKEYEESIKIANNEVIETLKKRNIKFTIRTKMLNTYHLYQKLNKGYKLNDIHDLVNVKIILEDNEDPYVVLGLIHKLYTPMNNKFKDYIACPKTNMYRSLHTTVFGPDNHLLQFQIKTTTMDDINTIGLAAYWKYFKEEGKTKMQHELKLNYQFFNTLRDLNAGIDSDSDFIDRVQQEIFSNNIYVYTLRGDIIELPNGATVIDFAYKIHTDIGNHLYKAYINGKEVKLTHKLNNKDRIMLYQKDEAKPSKTWLEHVVTSRAKRKIKDALKD